MCCSCDAAPKLGAKHPTQDRLLQAILAIQDLRYCDVPPVLLVALPANVAAGHGDAAAVATCLACVATLLGFADGKTPLR